MNLANFFSINNDGKINLFGFSLYSDDLLIIAILFFLYSQNVNDKYIYIALFLLLLSK